MRTRDCQYVGEYLYLYIGFENVDVLRNWDAYISSGKTIEHHMIHNPHLEGLLQDFLLHGHLIAGHI